jgi:putative Mg2+ transporter-C (MgtC) family protein
MEATMISELDMILRVLAASALGALVGYERERVSQPAGLRTHMVLVAGAALAMTLSINLGISGGGDVTRLAAQVLSGIGFLGAGAILRYGPNVRGLTTAASLWTMTVVGLAVGAGYFFVAATITVLLLIVLSLVSLIERRFVRHSIHITITAIAVDRPGIEEQVRQMLSETCLGVANFHADRHINRHRIKIMAEVRLKAGQPPETVSNQLGQVKGMRIVRYE